MEEYKYRMYNVYKGKCYPIGLATETMRLETGNIGISGLIPHWKEYRYTLHNEIRKDYTLCTTSGDPVILYVAIA